MNNEIIINRTTLNGTKWQIVADNFGAALYMNDKYSGYYFRSIEEAQAHLDKVDERVRTPYVPQSCEVPSDYYGVAGRYYGD